PARPVARGARRRAPPHAGLQAPRAALRRRRAGMEAQLPDDALPRRHGGAQHPARDRPVERHRLARARGGGLHRTLPLALLADRALPGAAPPRPAAAARVKKLATLLLLVLAGSTAAQLHVSRQTYAPVIRVATPEGLTYTTQLQPASERAVCAAASKQFLASLKTQCPACEVRFARCER